ncbi:hypothetical protein V2J09_009008 [Rumex salicifolius]
MEYGVGLGRYPPATSWQSRLMGKLPPVAMVWGVRGPRGQLESRGLKFDAELFVVLSNIQQLQSFWNKKIQPDDEFLRGPRKSKVRFHDFIYIES